MKNKPKTPWKRVTAYSGLCLLLWAFCLSTHIWHYGFTDHAIHSDCAIVLGAATSGNSPSPVFEERIKHAINLYNSGTVKKLVFTGGIGERKSRSEGSVGTAYALKNQVPASAIFYEENSLTTRQNLIEAKLVMNDNHLKTAVIVSDPLHLRRAKFMANGLKLDTVTSPTPTSRYRSFKTRFPFLIRELYFIHHYWVFSK